MKKISLAHSGIRTPICPVRSLFNMCYRHVSAFLEIIIHLKPSGNYMDHLDFPYLDTESTCVCVTCHSPNEQ